MGGGNNSLFYKEFVKTERAVQASVSHPCSELSGEFLVQIISYPDYTFAETEEKIQDAISFLTKGRTTLVIAHRLSTILNSDKIYVIDSGKVIGKGRHEDLLKKSEIYKNFYEKQIQKS